MNLNLNRSLNRPLNRRLRQVLTRRLDGHPFRPRNNLREACTLLARYVRLRQKEARAQPHLYGPYASRYYQDTLQLEETYRQIDAALDRVYGPEPVHSPPRPSVWQERYEIRPRQMPFFRKWFRDNYER